MSELSGIKIAIDVEHGSYGEHEGGYEEGAEYKGHHEWDLNKKSVHVCADFLFGKGAEVDIFEYPKGSQNLTLAEMGSRSIGHDIFISIHHNSFNDPRVQRTEVLVHPNGTTEDTKLAQCIQDSLLTALKVGNGKVKSQNLGILKTVPPIVKACCLVEAFFITGSLPDTAESLAQKEGEAFANGISDYLS